MKVNIYLFDIFDQIILVNSIGHKVLWIWGLRNQPSYRSTDKEKEIGTEVKVWNIGIWKMQPLILILHKLKKVYNTLIQWYYVTIKHQSQRTLMIFCWQYFHLLNIRFVYSITAIPHLAWFSITWFYIHSMIFKACISSLYKILHSMILFCYRIFKCKTNG